MESRRTVEFTGTGYHVRVKGEGEDILPETDDNLILKAFRFTLERLKIEPPAGAIFHCENHIPLGSGSGIKRHGCFNGCDRGYFAPTGF